VRDASLFHMGPTRSTNIYLVEIWRNFATRLLRIPLYFRAGQSVAWVPAPAIKAGCLQPYGGSSARGFRSWQHSAVATDGDFMSKSKQQSGYKRQTSTSRPASAPKRAAAKSAKAVPKKSVPLRPGKTATIIAMVRRPKGASIADLAKATDWQTHSVRGAISGAIKKKLGLNVTSETIGSARVYRIVDKAGA